jgi:AhpC/TSA family
MLLGRQEAAAWNSVESDAGWGRWRPLDRPETGSRRARPQLRLEHCQGEWGSPFTAPLAGREFKSEASGPKASALDAGALRNGNKDRSLEPNSVRCPRCHFVLPCQGGKIQVGAPTGRWLLIVVYRGKHDPVSRNYLAALQQIHTELEELGVEVLAVSGDPRERAEAFVGPSCLPNACGMRELSCLRVKVILRPTTFKSSPARNSKVGGREEMVETCFEKGCSLRSQDVRDKAGSSSASQPGQGTSVTLTNLICDVFKGRDTASRYPG